MKVFLVVLFIFSTSLRLFSENAEELTLEECIRAALSSNRDIQLTELTLKKAAERYREVKAENGFSLTTNGDYIHTGTIHDSREEAQKLQTDSTTSAGTARGGLELSGPSTRISLSGSHSIRKDDEFAHSSSLTLSANQTLWDGYPGGKASASVKQAEITYKKEELTAEAGRQSVLYSVKRAFYTMLSAQNDLKLKEEILKQREKEYERVNTLYEAGKESGVTLKQAKVNLLSAEIDMEESRSALSIARKNLSALTGLSPSMEYRVIEEKEISVPELELKKLMETASLRRTDLRQLYLEIESLKISERLSKSKASPVISISGEVGYSRDWDLETDYSSWSAGINASIPILDWGDRKAELEQIETQKKINSIRIEKLNTEIALEIEENVNTVKTLLSKLELSQARMSLAEDEYTLVETQYNENLASTMDLLEASVKLSTAQAEVQNVKSQLNLAILELEKSAGL